MILELDGLGVRFGTREILKDLRVSLSGRAIGLLGPHGAGKSTLIQTLVGFVRMMGELSGLPRETALERAHEALFYVGLGEARYRLLGTYSLGMKQLAKLAQAIVHGPKLVILDEPTNGLDPPARQRMIRLIREMKDAGEMHLLLCSHLLRDVEETCDEVLILQQGRIV